MIFRIIGSAILIFLQLTVVVAQNCSSVGIEPLLPMVGPDWGGFTLMYSGNFNESLIYGVRYQRPDVPNAEGILKACYANTSTSLICGASGVIAGSSISEFWNIILVEIHSGSEETVICKDEKAFRFTPMRFSETYSYGPVASSPWESRRVTLSITGTEYYFTNKTQYRCLWILPNPFSVWPPVAETEFTKLDKQTGYCDTPIFTEIATNVLSLPFRATFIVVGTDGFTTWQQTLYQPYDFIGKGHWVFLEEEITGHSPMTSPNKTQITVYGKNLQHYLPDDYEQLYPIKYALSFENGYFYLKSASCEYVNSTQLICTPTTNRMGYDTYPMVLLMIYPDDEEYFIYVSTFTIESTPIVQEPVQISSATKEWPCLIVCLSIAYYFL